MIVDIITQCFSGEYIMTSRLKGRQKPHVRWRIYEQKFAHNQCLQNLARLVDSVNQQPAAFSGPGLVRTP